MNKGKKKNITAKHNSKPKQQTISQRISAQILAGVGWIICGLGSGLIKLGNYLRHWKAELQED